MSDNFFKQHSQPLDLSEIGGFDVFGIPETPTIRHGGGFFEIKTVITYKDIVEYISSKLIHNSPNEHPYIPIRLYVADLKEESIKRDVELLRLYVCDSFLRQLEILNDRRSYFYTPKEKIVQYVRTPVSFIDHVPGDTSISYSIFTERYLGSIDDEKETTRRDL